MNESGTGGFLRGRTKAYLVTFLGHLGQGTAQRPCFTSFPLPRRLRGPLRGRHRRHPPCKIRYTLRENWPCFSSTPRCSNSSVASRRFQATTSPPPSAREMRPQAPSHRPDQPHPGARLRTLLQHFQIFGPPDHPRWFTRRVGPLCRLAAPRAITMAAGRHRPPRQAHSLSLPSARRRRRQLRKQDCEITAGYRMLQRLRADYPRMAAIIVADSLYSKQPFVEQVTAKRFSFLLVAKPGDHKSLYQGRGAAPRQPARPPHHRPPGTP